MVFNASSYQNDLQKLCQIVPRKLNIIRKVLRSLILVKFTMASKNHSNCYIAA